MVRPPRRRARRKPIGPGPQGQLPPGLLSGCSISYAGRRVIVLLAAPLDCRASAETPHSALWAGNAICAGGVRPILEAQDGRKLIAAAGAYLGDPHATRMERDAMPVHLTTVDQARGPNRGIEGFQREVGSFRPRLHQWDAHRQLLAIRGFRVFYEAGQHKL